jgi:tRNA (mo5U34)-methyltransferase
MISKDLYSDIFSPGIFFQREDFFFRYQEQLSKELFSRRRDAFTFLERGAWESVFTLFSRLPDPEEAGYFVADGVVSTTQGASDGEVLSELIRLLVPWRKGPWNIAGNRIDAEWRSDVKYDGICEIIRSVRGASVLDIGSGNGFYGYRALNDGASMVLCLDPSEKFFFQFELFQRFAKEQRIQYELLSYEYAGMLPLKFDIALCMGIIYHQKNPFEVLDCARKALKPGGLLVLESMTYPSNESISFIPPGRFAKARNVYQVPSAPAMVSMCLNSGFSDAEIVLERPLSLEEQRRTEYAPYESLADFLDPDDRTRTIEGYPAPNRAVVVAKNR